MKDTGVVIIGRNEGERLRRCIASIRGAVEHLVYVDSGSTDGSAAWARDQGVAVVELDMSTPFTAGRARNAGLEHLRRTLPGIEFVQCVDGDCELLDAWLEAAVRAMRDNPKLGVVCGRLHEKDPNRSIFNRLSQMEWDAPAIGPVPYSGGIFMVRAAVFEAVRGFDPTLRAGEEPELGARIRAAGFHIVRLDVPMAVHDSAMTRVQQYWQRQVRTAWGAMDLRWRFGIGTHRRELASARFWTIGWLLLVAGCPLVGVAVTGRPAAWVAAALAALCLPLQMLRVALRLKRHGESWPNATGGGFLIMAAKWPQMLGQLRYAMAVMRGKAPVRASGDGRVVGGER